MPQREKKSTALWAITPISLGKSVPPDSSQREGIAIAKRNGVYKGRKKVTTPDNFPILYERYTRREMNKGQLAEALHVTRPTLERMIREYQNTKSGRNF